MNLVNLTPHTLNLINGDNIITIEPSGVIARLSTSTEVVDNVKGIDIETTNFGDIVDLPSPTKGAIYITSALVASTANRPDVLSPGQLVRNDQGAVIGCKSLIRHTKS